MLSNRCLALFVLILLSGCPTTNSDPPPSTGAGGTAGAPAAGGTAGQGTSGLDAGVVGESTKLPSDAAVGDPGKPLAEGCAANSECASGFCVDGVCCNAACGDQCYSCNLAGSAGYCTPQIAGDDLNAAVPCTGAHTCSIAISALNLVACRLKNLQGCKVGADCATLNCVSFYVDHDGDGYGKSNTTLNLCETSDATPPGGYVTVGGDCCDNDSTAFPGQTKYFASPDACGSWDYNCDGTIQGSEGGVITYATVPVSECGTNVHGSCDSCTDTIECR